MIQLTLKDGSIRELEAPTAAAEVIKGNGMGLYKPGGTDQDRG